MSHWTVCRVRIRNPNLELLRQAVEVIAKELGVNEVVENFIVEGYDGSKRCLFAIPIELPYGNGYGVYVDSMGYVRVAVDDHGAPLTVEEFAQKLVQYYTALAIAQVAPQLGFAVQNMQQLDQGVLIDLVR
ncbi:MAG: hypothetical protein DRJ67_07235 [Thermoprotei archaeon]|nr:MAG: hypothetical protein DRJ67_07235 [Thermoprotei archaeon]